MFFKWLNPDWQHRKAPEEFSKSPWSLHIGSFLKTHFINPPEVRGQVDRWRIYGQDNVGAKVSKCIIWVNRKIAQIAPISTSGPNSRNEKHIQALNADRNPNQGIISTGREVSTLWVGEAQKRLWPNWIEPGRKDWNNRQNRCEQVEMRFALV